MSELITGKEAWIAKSEHKDVDWMLNGLGWQELTDSEFMGWDTSRFLGQTKYKFRLKPKTIMINGIEVPAPFEPKEGDVVWIISDRHHGYRETQYNKSIYNAFGAWRTEEEIKQVVDSLRKVFVINNQ